MEVSRWPVVWFFLSAVVVIWDCSFVLLRPHTFRDGTLYSYFAPYSLYVEIDTPYGDLTNEFIWAQAWLNLVEVSLEFITIYLILSQNTHALLTGLIVNVMTFWKTLLYMLQYLDMCNGGHRLKHLEMGTMVLLFLVPNAFWLVVPFLLIIYYTKKLSGFLSQKAQMKKD